MLCCQQLTARSQIDTYLLLSLSLSSNYLAGSGQHISRTWGEKEKIRQVIETFVNLNPEKNTERALDWLEFYDKMMQILLVRLTDSCQQVPALASSLRDIPFEECLSMRGDDLAIWWEGCVCVILC